jgi:hypothetical protein
MSTKIVALRQYSWIVQWRIVGGGERWPPAWKLSESSPCSFRWISELLGLRRCDQFLWEAAMCGRGQFGNQEERKRQPLEAATKQWIVNIWLWTLCRCNSEMWSVVKKQMGVTKYPINPNNNRNAVYKYDHSTHMTMHLKNRLSKLRSKEKVSKAECCILTSGSIFVSITRPTNSM